MSFGSVNRSGGVYIVGKRKPDADSDKIKEANAKRVAEAIKRTSEIKRSG